MQIGIDLGATKIEYVILDDNGEEILREREISPTDYQGTIESIFKIVEKLDKKFSKKFDTGICHPGSISNDTGFLKNAVNSPWMNNKPFQSDISKKLNRNVICENDANCFALSEAIDGSAKHYDIVFGIILGYIFYDDLPDVPTLIGGLVITVSEFTLYILKSKNSY